MVNLDNSTAVVSVSDKILHAKEVVRDIFQGKISYRQLLCLAKKGEINCTQIGHKFIFSESEVRKWLVKRMTSPVWRDKKI